ncbi:HET-domain-containing protein [Annulohypoxylon moriforme]|nr:HET-domain-containing protein [Annulohypoxylon moriforme]
MRLLNAHNLELVNFEGQNIPSYIILSHTWGKEEVTFKDLSKNHFRHKDGFSKIEGCRLLALQYYRHWLWVDTCCIDQSSSAELSEAINSMYKWYQQADFCVAYLADVTKIPYPTLYQDRDFRKSRWFTRGWTLQELLAPKIVRFYDASWRFIDLRNNLSGLISEITGISADVIDSPDMAEQQNIALKFSWASRRETSREEDMAYCLMGLFGVNMPLLYGEGGVKAFHRLQNELMKDQYDHSILAWGLTPGTNAPPYQSRMYLLAPSPASFHGWNTRVKSLPPEVTHYNPTNLGLLITLPIIFLSDDFGLGILECENDVEVTRIALPLSIRHRIDAVSVGKRCRGVSPFFIPKLAIQKARRITLYLRDGNAMPSRVKYLDFGWSALSKFGYELAEYFPPHAFDQISFFDGKLSTMDQDLLMWFRCDDSDDIFILYRPSRHPPVQNSTEAWSGYVAIGTRPNSYKSRRQQVARPVTLWELLSQPDFNKVHFEKAEKLVRWNEYVDVLVKDPDEYITKGVRFSFSSQTWPLFITFNYFPLRNPFVHF